MLVFTALYAFSSAALASPDPHQAFRDWLWQAVKAENLGIDYWGAVDLDGDGEADEAMAALCGIGMRDSHPIRVYEADGRRWLVEARDYRCRDKAVEPPPFGQLAMNAVGFELGGNKHDETIFLGVVDGRLEFTRWESSGSGMMTSYRHEKDWVRRVTMDDWTNFWEERITLPSGEVEVNPEMGGQINRAALIVVEPKATERPTLNRVLSGADAYDGPDDATLTLSAVEPSPGHVDVIIRVKDDVRTSEDHLELWWCGTKGDCRAYDSVRQLTVRWAPDATPTTGAPRQPPMVAWAMQGAPDGPKPRVTQAADGTITVHFTHEQLGIDKPESWSRPFTVVYVDVDAPSGPQTRIATSDLEWTERVRYRFYTLGTLTRFTDLRPFPTPADAARVTQSHITAIRALEPGDTLLRALPEP